MTLYFCLSDVLDRIETASGENRLDILIEVSDKIPECDGYPADAFYLSSHPKVLPLDEAGVPHQLLRLLEEAALYRINMELALDEALSERHRNSIIMKAVTAAFAGETLPYTLPGSELGADSTGSLRHPILDRLDNLKLCEVYARFLAALGPGRLDHNFEQDILGKHQKRFMDLFDGFVHAGQGKIKAGILVGFGTRRDHEGVAAPEGQAQKGHMKARKMRISEPHELVWAWLECDHYQMRRCRDIHRIKMLGALPRLPNWVKKDTALLLEKEAMKQVFAETLLQADPGLQIADRAPGLKAALQVSAQGQENASLQKILSQLTGAGAYDGAAQQIAGQARQRQAEARMAGLA